MKCLECGTELKVCPPPEHALVFGSKKYKFKEYKCQNKKCSNPNAIYLKDLTTSNIVELHEIANKVDRLEKWE
jgi:hypothetical protein